MQQKRQTVVFYSVQIKSNVAVFKNYSNIIYNKIGMCNSKTFFFNGFRKNQS